MDDLTKLLRTVEIDIVNSYLQTHYHVYCMTMEGEAQIKKFSEEQMREFMFYYCSVYIPLRYYEEYIQEKFGLFF